MNHVDPQLLNNYQQRFPLAPAPFAIVGEEMGIDEQSVLARMRDFVATGVVSRVGPVFRPNAVGVSTLAAMRVPEDSLDKIADVVSAFPAVNHNYARSHPINLWFVVTAETPAKLSNVLEQIELETGHPVLRLPMLHDYHIDLGFSMPELGQHTSRDAKARQPTDSNHDVPIPGEQAPYQDLVGAVQGGLPLVSRPYRSVASTLGWDEMAVIERLQEMIGRGDIKRFGVIVRHQELGYRANAMVVWDVPDRKVDLFGRRLRRQPGVTLCYRRARALPEWPYNLYCMIHGRRREDVVESIERLKRAAGLESFTCEVLFSTRRYKQRGAIYRGRA